MHRHFSLFDRLRRTRALIALVSGFVFFGGVVPVGATITITSVVGASSYIAPIAATPTMTGTTPGQSSTTPQTNPTIYGGLSGLGNITAACTAANSDGTCNSCSATLPPQECNTKAIHGDLQIQFSSSSTAGYPQLMNSLNTNMIPNAAYIPQGTVTTVSIPWGTICSNASSNNTPDCSAPFLQSFTLGVAQVAGNALSDSLTIMIGVEPSLRWSGATSDTSDDCTTAQSETGAGACSYSLFPGDGKAYVSDLGVPSTFPTTVGNLSFTGLRFFFDTATPTPLSTYSDIMLSNAANGANQAITTSTSGTINLMSPYFDGMNNDTTYNVMMASVDQANNQSYYVLPPQSITPEAVVGLLDQQFNCFVATAAFGSPLNSKVKTFRLFRDRVLLTTRWGRQFVRWYYLHSPGWAATIRAHAGLKTAARIVLWPAWAFSALSLRWGARLTVGMLLVSLLGTLLAVGLLHVRRKRHKPLASAAQGSTP